MWFPAAGRELFYTAFSGAEALRRTELPLRGLAIMYFVFFLIHFFFFSVFSVF
jgi:hypothetical protein